MRFHGVFITGINNIKLNNMTNNMIHDLANLKQELQNWFNDIIKNYPPINIKSINKLKHEDDLSITDYTAGSDYILASFARETSNKACKKAITLAEKYGLGYYDISSKKGEVYLPNTKGRLKHAFSCRLNDDKIADTYEDWHFYCESKDDIPLPPKYTFPQAFNYLNSTSNSFYILENKKGYIQCGGSRNKCSIEFRECFKDGTFKHFIFINPKGNDEDDQIQMSGGIISKKNKYCFDYLDAAKLFLCYFEGEKWPDEIQFEDITASFK